MNRTFRLSEFFILESFGKKDRIGYGSSNFVYQTKCDPIGTVAIKEATKTSNNDDICIKYFINEVMYLIFLMFDFYLNCN